ncbi:MAG: manganese efflux pump MntP family protein [Bacteroidetes bacterium]|nr:manganese efflux pump MntP family protein [Bacteroidota bacterium]
MSFLEIMIISVGLAMDAFAVSIGSGTLSSMRDMRSKIRLAFHFGLFQFLMPVIGWFLGSTVQSYVEQFDHWIGFVLLSYIGIKMIYESFGNDHSARQNPSKGKSLVILSVATSIDALAVGFTLAMLSVNIWYPCIIIGIVTALLSITGIQLGEKLGVRFGKKMELLGGLVLIAIGVKILLEHIS